MANQDQFIDTKWEESRKLANALNMRINALGIRAKNLIDARQISERSGILLPGIDDWLLNVQGKQALDARIQRTISGVLTGDLGLRRSEQKPGDIDVMAPPGTTNDQLTQYQFGWILIVIGVAVVFGLVSGLLHEHKQASELRKVYKPLYDICNQKLAGNPEWEAKKGEVEFKSRQSTWEKLEKGASKLLSGSQIGLVIAIPVVAMILVSWLKPKNR